ncbi:hypothetical protein PX554_06405 [Sphingomonas sp. H39-1-10]|uniref:hypothetical protein n=1 Tax=Sphingomonas pollutisoli TaxID=3030829 RepID=UPI0023BA1C26|nr:hypothetical protein [Sphingomonas pollutisoli]MDF0487755.1 hypothetical protein [Sphingomonas pollutisoli]
MLDFGAKCDGVTDDAGAINAALSNPVTVVIPNATCRAASTIVVQSGANLVGTTFSTQEPPSGSVLQCDISVSPCVTVVEPFVLPQTRGGQLISDLTISRAAGQIPNGTTCLYTESFFVMVRYVNCNGHAIGYRVVQRIATGGYGTIAKFNNVSSCNIVDTDIVMDGLAEFNIDTGRFGCNGTRNPGRHNNYISITGGAGGPNTIKVTNSQFNDIQNPTCFINWNNLTAVPPTTSEFSFTGNHLEFTGQAESPHNVFCSDHSAGLINLVRFNDNEIRDNNGTGTVFNFDAGTALGDWRMHGNSWVGFNKNGWTLALAQPLLIFNSSGETFNNPRVTVVGAASQGQSSVVFEGNSYAGGLTVGGNFGNAFPTRFGGVLAGGTVTNTASSPVEIDIPGYSLTDGSNNIAVRFGGVNAALGFKNAKWQLRGSILTYSFFVSISSLGTGSGTAELLGLPFPAGASAPLGTFPVYCLGMTGLPGPIMITVNALSTSATFVTSGASGISLVTSGNFTSNSQCQGALSYSIQ